MDPHYDGNGHYCTIRSNVKHLRGELVGVLTQQHFSGVTSGLAQIKALQAAEKSSQASLQANQTGYEVGVRINIDVLNAQQQLYETQRSLSRARYDTLMSSLRLKASSGILTDQDIVAINQLLTDLPS